MKFRIVFSFVFVLFGLVSSANGLPKNIFKKVSKEIVSLYESKDFELKKVVIKPGLNEQLAHPIDSNNLYQILVLENLVGYAYIAKAPSKTDEFDYMVLLDKELIIVKSKLLIYREDYGAEIGSKRWLKQFNGLKEGVKVEYGNEIIPISGATISAESMTVAINNLLESIAILNKNGVFN